MFDCLFVLSFVCLIDCLFVWKGGTFGGLVGGLWVGWLFVCWLACCFAVDAMINTNAHTHLCVFDVYYIRIHTHIARAYTFVQIYDMCSASINQQYDY